MLGEFLGAPGSDDPFAWDRLIRTAADDIARATDCYSAIAGMDVTANQALYAPPQPAIYKRTGVFWRDAALVKRELTEVTAQELDRRRCWWRTDPPGSPRFYVPMGANQLVLYPTPDTSSLIFAYTDLVVQANTFQVGSAGQRAFVSTDAGTTLRLAGGDGTGFNAGVYTVVAEAAGIATLDRPAGIAASASGIGALSTGGVEIEGYGVPGDTWPSPGDVCPLPDRAHICVAYRAAILRTMQRPSQENIARRAMLQDEYARAKGMLERETALAGEATRYADSTRLIGSLGMT